MFQVAIRVLQNAAHPVTRQLHKSIPAFASLPLATQVGLFNEVHVRKHPPGTLWFYVMEQLADRPLNLLRDV